MKTLPDGAELKAIRDRLRYTQEDLSEKAGISLRTYQRMEGGRLVKAENLESVAKALSIQTAAIVRPSGNISLAKYPRLSGGFADRESDLFSLIAKLEPVPTESALSVLEKLIALGVPVHDLYGVSIHTVGFELSDEMATWHANWGVLHVSTGEPGEPAGTRTIHNRPIYMERAGRSKSWTARIPYPKNRGVRFKCFVDLEHGELEGCRQALERHFGTTATIGEGELNRVWFLLPTYKIVKDPVGIEDNAIYPV